MENSTDSIKMTRKKVAFCLIRYGIGHDRGRIYPGGNQALPESGAIVSPPTAAFPCFSIRSMI